MLSPKLFGGSIEVWPLELPKFFVSAVEELKPLFVIDLGKNLGY